MLQALSLHYLFNVVVLQTFFVALSLNVSCVADSISKKCVLVAELVPEAVRAAHHPAEPQ
jgi:hypothetical protein